MDDGDRTGLAALMDRYRQVVPGPTLTNVMDVRLILVG